MGLIPKVISEKGYENIGLLSTLYLTKNRENFFGGLFLKEKKINLIILVGHDILVFPEIKEDEIENLLRGDVKLTSLMSENYRQFSLMSKKKSRYRLIIRKIQILLLEMIQMIQLTPNAYYHWNQFKYFRQSTR